VCLAFAAPAERTSPAEPAGLPGVTRIVRPGSAGRAARRREAGGSRRHRVGDLVREIGLAQIRDRGGWEPQISAHTAARDFEQTAGPVFIL